MFGFAEMVDQLSVFDDLTVDVHTADREHERRGAVTHHVGLEADDIISILFLI